MKRQSSPVLVGIRGLSAIAVAVQALACSGGVGDAPPGDSPSSSGGGSGAGAPVNGPGPAGGTGGTDLTIDLGGSMSSEPKGPGMVCTAETHEGQRVPVDMYFLVDSSGSMADEVDGGSKWDVVSAALVSFLNDPRNSETGVGIGYFPSGPQNTCTAGQADCLCIPIINLCISLEGGSCTTDDYAMPAVSLMLPPNPAPVVADINAHEISGGTPTRPAVEGALQYLSQWADAHPDRKSVLVLATDGEPSGCTANTPQDVADVAAAALAGPHAIQTFVIGVGSELASLNLVAQAGGTGQAFLVDTGADVSQLFSDALEQIRGAAASCDFAIPAESSGGMSVDPSKVNVRYTPAGATESTLVTQTLMSDPNNCDSEGGWYYDNPSAPSLIKLCSSTCQLLSGGSIQVEFGCDTVTQVPK